MGNLAWLEPIRWRIKSGKFRDVDARAGLIALAEIFSNEVRRVETSGREEMRKLCRTAGVVSMCMSKNDVTNAIEVETVVRDMLKDGLSL
jgi:hypothetical protein